MKYDIFATIGMLLSERKGMQRITCSRSYTESATQTGLEFQVLESLYL